MNRIILISILIAVLASFYASSNPDGLEKVAENLGFIDRGIESHSIMTDYSVSFIEHENISTATAGAAGIFLTFGLFFAAAKMSRKGK